MYLLALNRVLKRIKVQCTVFKQGIFCISLLKILICDPFYITVVTLSCWEYHMLWLSLSGRSFSFSFKFLNKSKQCYKPLNKKTSIYLFIYLFSRSSDYCYLQTGDAADPQWQIQDKWNVYKKKPLYIQIYFTFKLNFIYLLHSISVMFNLGRTVDTFTGTVSASTL